MNHEEAVAALWPVARAGAPFPAELKNSLNLDQGLRIQLGILARKQAEGEKLAGWKVGLTSAVVRKKFGSEERPFGHIMAHRVHEAGAVIPGGSISGCGVEAEMCFTIGQTVQGPGVTPEGVRAAVAAVSPAFEVLERRGGGGADFPLAVADNLSQWGIVVGAATTPAPDGATLDGVTMEMKCDGASKISVVGGEVIDDHFLSLSLLANRLGEYGLALEAGQRVITGSFTKHDPLPGQNWEATFSGLGKVWARFD